MLQGSLQTVAIPEVLQFLESTSKTGELTVSGSDGSGRLWFDSGIVSGFESRSSREPGEAVFELMGITDGEFVFTAADSGQPAPSARTTKREVGPLLAEAQALMEEWGTIVGVVASLDHFVQLVADPPGDPVTIGRAQWAAVVAIGSGCSVAEVISGCDLSEIAGCRVIRDLVEAGVATITARPTVVSEPDVQREALAVGSISLDRPSYEAPSYPAEGAAAVVEKPESDRVGILGFDFGTLVADFPVPAATPSSGDPTDAEPELAVVAPDVTFSDLNELPTSHGYVDTPTPSAEDRYAALRAAMLEVGENLESTIDTPGGDPAGYEDARSGYEDADSGYGTGEVDALADRGPWSESELAQINESGAWDPDTGSAEGRGSYDGSVDVAFTPSGSSPEASDGFGADEVEGAEELAEQPAEEPINRGLLLKFLSSVRN